MPATPARIGFISQEFRTDFAEDIAVKARYGNAARDTTSGIVETFFDTLADVKAIAEERLTLLKADRRKVKATTRGIVAFTGGLDFSQNLPAMRVIDPEKLIDRNMALVSIKRSYGANTTELGLWG